VGLCWPTSSTRHNCSQTQRSVHSSNLYTVKPCPEERIGAEYRDPVDGTKEAITDTALLQQLFNSAGPMFDACCGRKSTPPLPKTPLLDRGVCAKMG